MIKKVVTLLILFLSQIELPSQAMDHGVEINDETASSHKSFVYKKRTPNAPMQEEEQGEHQTCEENSIPSVKITSFSNYKKFKNLSSSVQEQIWSFSKLRNIQPIVIVSLGHPGSGKGTFSQTLTCDWVTHYSVGDYLREELKKETDIGLRWIQEIKETGILAVGVVKEVTTDLVFKINSTKPQVYILDGHIRTLEQAKHFNELLSKNTNILPFYVYIDAEIETCIKRMINRRTCGNCSTIYNLLTMPPKIDEKCDNCGSSLTQRNTDNISNAQNRIQLYSPHLEQTLEYYRERKELIEFNGNLPLSECAIEYKKIFF